MSQADFEIANQGFPSFRSDLNSNLQALASNSAGATEPSSTYAYQFWYDETTDLLKLRNSDDDAWITLAYFDQTNDEWEIRSAVIQAVDSAGVVIKTDDGTTRVTVADNGDVSFYEDTGTTPKLFWDASAERLELDNLKLFSNNVRNEGGVLFIGTSGSDRIQFYNNDVNTMQIDSSGNVGIGTSSPQSGLSGATFLHIHDSGTDYAQLRLTNATSGLGANNGLEIHTNGTNAFINQRENGYIATYTNGSERMRIDNNGSFLIGETSTGDLASPTGNGLYCTAGGELFVGNNGSIVAYFNRNSSDGEIIRFRQANATEGSISVSGSTVSYNGGHLARWSQSIDKTRIDELVKGTVLSNLDEMCEWKQVEFDYQHLVSEAVQAQDAVYETQTDEDGNETEVLISEAVEAQDAVYETRTMNSSYDGDANVGDVIDWTHEDQDVQATVVLEDNEQLNRMKVSDVEGDPNVAGVFVNWDDDDDVHTADMNIAMTGDMVIRIAQGTTVHRGDLLMSAGDGTAKPQGDDIVRSKTIAKVTSTHVSHTYDDGSYLVPCVLMAC